VLTCGVAPGAWVLASSEKQTVVEWEGWPVKDAGISFIVACASEKQSVPPDAPLPLFPEGEVSLKQSHGDLFIVSSFP